MCTFFLFEDLVLEKRLENLARCSRFHSQNGMGEPRREVANSVKPVEFGVSR